MATTQFGSSGTGMEFFYNSGLPQRTRRRTGDEDDKRIIPTQVVRSVLITHPVTWEGAL